MKIWEHGGWHGWRVDTNSCYSWFNLTGSYNDNASSLDTGNHTGTLSVDNDGEGDRIGWGPRVLIGSLGDYTRNFGFDTYNDDVSSRHRC
ncbi:hypothetical protein [Conexibacter sp. SYSU D00693]|uniref:hypothetical protein n=1 Tax=Conexibacter sp. SYSU D00693 TaxID=2812560 RepID=UPI00196AC3E3|nr:hypothetical protein [Conexibacter sp. SYSU D00693]